MQGKGESTEGRAPTLNLLSSHTADGGSDQLAFLVFTSTPKLWVTGGQQGLHPGIQVVLHLPFTYPLPALSLTSVVNSSTSFMDSSLPANRVREACCSASRC